MRCTSCEAVDRGLTFLKSAPDDALIEEAIRVFAQHANAGRHFDSFEVWDGTRFVYRSDRTRPTPSGTEGARG